MSRKSKLLQALVNDEQTEITPMTRAEKYLKACTEQCGCGGLPQPISRDDELMYELAEKMTEVNKPKEIATAAEMDALLVAANVGKVYKFTGTTDANYTHGELYEVVSE